MTPLKKDLLLPTVIATILAKAHKAILIASVWVKMCFTGIATNSHAGASIFLLRFLCSHCPLVLFFTGGKISHRYNIMDSITTKWNSGLS